MKIRIFVLSGKRGGYGALRPFLKRIDNSKNFELTLALTDQHLSEKFGHTFEEVKKDFKNLTFLPLKEYGSDPSERGIAMTNLQKLLIESFSKSRPDFVVLYGDRAESLACAFVANIFSIKIIHFQGGDKSGSVDEHFRHAITKLSHLHLVSCEESKKRVLQLGENFNDVKVVGDSHVDEIIDNQIIEYTKMRKFLNIKKDTKLITLLQHSETTQVDKSSMQIKETLKAIERFKKKHKNYEIVAIYPCSDPGYKEIIESLKSSSAVTHLFKNLEAEIFRALVKNSDVLLGNSSAGVIESPYLGTPSINIGRRQSDRLISSMTFNVSHDAEEIFKALERVISISNLVNEKLYGNGNSDLKAFEFLNERLDSLSFAKTFSDI